MFVATCRKGYLGVSKKFGPNYERELIACMLKDIRETGGVELFRPFCGVVREGESPFRVPKCATVFSGMLSAEMKRGVDILTVGMVESECLKIDPKHGMNDITELSRVAFNETYVAGSTKQFLAERLYRKRMERAIELFDDGNYDDMVEEITSASRQIAQLDTQITSFFDGVRDRIEMYATRDRKVIPTGFPTLDKMLEGGLARGGLGIVFGPTGRGKSFFLINLAFGALKAGYTVAYLSLEILLSDLSARFDSLITGEGSRNYRAANPNALRRLPEQVRKFAEETKSKLFVDSVPSLTIPGVRSYLDKLFSRHNVMLDLLVVDYAALMTSNRHFEQRYREIAWVVEHLREIAQERNMAVWTAAQGTRSSLDKDIPTAMDLAECYSQAATADVLIALCQTPEEKKNKMMRLWIDKNREGTSAQVVQCQFLANMAKIREKGKSHWKHKKAGVRN